MYIPNCESPILLVNRAAVNYICLGFSLHHPLNVKINNTLDSIPQSKLLDWARLNPTLLDSCFVQLPNGHKEPLYLLAPCGHCVLCRDNKRNDYVFRSVMESACYTCPPMFFTLTYDNDHLPDNKQLRYKDVQDFLKRLRKRWSDKGIKHSIRYLVCGEYGSRFGRPHYHMIMWNNPYNADETDPIKMRQLSDDIFVSWGNCQRSAFDFGQCRGGSAAYTAKYVAKQGDLHGHYIKPFLHMSVGNGGLGSPLLKKLQSYLRASPQLRKLSFRSLDGDLIEINFSSYITSKVWPSPTRLINSSLRNLYKQFNDLLQIYQMLHLYTYAECVEFSSLLNPCPDYLPMSYKAVDTYKFLCPTALLYYRRLLDRIFEKITLELCQQVKLDSDYISKYYKYKSLTPELPNTSNASKILRIKQSNSASSDKEIF